MAVDQDHQHGGAAASARRKQLDGRQHQSERERRRVRLKEREMLQEMKENADELSHLMSDRFEKTTQKLNQVFHDSVVYAREANLDAFNLDELNAAVTKQSKHLSTSDLNKYDVADLIRGSREACFNEETEEFDWQSLGAASGACFRAVPEINFFFGLMNIEVVQKERKRTRRIQSQEEVEEIQPSQYTRKKEDRKDAQARRLQVLQAAMDQTERRELFDVVLNPQSFTQTVENLFDVSFLVRRGELEIEIDEDTGLPCLESHGAQEGEDEEMREATQTIISITPAEFERLAAVSSVQEPMVGHRQAHS